MRLDFVQYDFIAHEQFNMLYWDLYGSVVVGMFVDYNHFQLKNVSVANKINVERNTKDR